MILPPEDCDRCGLCKGRNRIVLPTGNLDSPIVFVGEAPGENEDIQGVPFVGRAGKILDDAMAAAGISRKDVMITNTVKCRPPNNRDPTSEEMEACIHFLRSELKGRKLVVGLGKSSCRDLMGYEGGMKDVVNKTVKIDVDGESIDFLPAYHPMACVYRKEARESLAETMRIIRGLL